MDRNKSPTKSCRVESDQPSSDIYEFNSQEEFKRIELCLLSDDLDDNEDNTFGLFGVSSSDDEELGNYLDAEMSGRFNRRRYFDEIPDEILETIFSQLPLIDLLLNLSVVCKRWYNIISSPNFLQWKKKYYRYKCQCEVSVKEIQDILKKDNLTDMTVFAVNLTR